MGSTGPKRDKFQRERDLEKIAQLYLSGRTQREIAETISSQYLFEISYQQVQKDLKTIRSRWVASQVRDFDQAKAQELERIDQIEREAWEAWRRSQNQKSVSVSETISAGGKTTSKTQLKLEDQVGDPAFLNVIANCVSQRRAILGLDAPKQAKVEANVSADVNFSADDWAKILAEAGNELSEICVSNSEDGGMDDGSTNHPQGNGEV